MNQPSSSTTSTALSNNTDFNSVLTSVHLIWIVVLAVLVITGIVYGVRLKRGRIEAERQVVEHAEQAGVQPRPAAEDGAAAPAPASAPIPDPAPTPAAPSTAAPSTGGAADGPVTQLKGLGPKVAARLGELGIANVGQLAALDHDAAQRLDAQLGGFSGRLERDRWVEQARFLAAGDVKGFEAVFGRL